MAGEQQQDVSAGPGRPGRDDEWVTLPGGELQARRRRNPVRDLPRRAGEGGQAGPRHTAGRHALFRVSPGRDAAGTGATGCGRGLHRQSRAVPDGPAVRAGRPGAPRAAAGRTRSVSGVAGPGRKLRGSSSPGADRGATCAAGDCGGPAREAHAVARARGRDTRGRAAIAGVLAPLRGGPLIERSTASQEPRARGPVRY